MAFCSFYGYDLPTEAEWEKAARGPDFDDQDEHCLYTWGNDKSTAKACFDISAGGKPVGYYDGNQTPVGDDMVNGYGLYDMTGNASEWTRTLAIDRRYTAGSTSSTTDYTFTIADYPQQEDLDSERNQYWNHLWAVQKYAYDSYSQFVNKSGQPIYSRSYGYAYAPCADNYQRIGFRVCRRYIADNATEEAEEEE